MAATGQILCLGVILAGTGLVLWRGVPAMGWVICGSWLTVLAVQGLLGGPVTDERIGAWALLGWPSCAAFFSLVMAVRAVFARNAADRR
jgi:hypothetical protein